MAVIAVFHALPTGRRIEPPAARARELSALSRPGRSLPGQNKEPLMRTLVVCSGGLDSVTLSHKIVIEKTLIHLVSFDYGQRHRQELDYARRCATRLGVTHDIIDITDIGRRLTGAALTDWTAVADESRS